MSEDEWTVVGKEGRSFRGRRRSTRTGENEQRLFLGDCNDKVVCRRSIAELTKQLRECGFYTSLKAGLSKAAPHLQNVTCIRCYGTGSPAASLEARCQLALLPLLLEVLPNKTKAMDVKVYDPVLTDADKEVIEQLGCSILQPEDAMQHATAEQVLFYMPHCDAALYNEVLDSNWDMQQLANLCFIGNSFSHMEDRWNMPTFKRRVGRPHRVIALVEHGLVREEWLAGEAFTVTTAFNDTSLHWFERDTLQAAPALFGSGTAMG
eukprot:jgi/Ulvmu1/3504/UM162_0011.1